VQLAFGIVHHTAVIVENHRLLRWLRFALAGATARESLLVLFKGEQRLTIFEVARLNTVVKAPVDHNSH
jgi:hypothetical protein